MIRLINNKKVNDMVKDFTKERIIINRKYPFLQNFPFNNEFTMEVVNSPAMVMMVGDDDTLKKPEPIINFTYANPNAKITITIEGDELLWVTDIAKSIKKLDRIAKRIDKGLKTKDLLIKRDISIEADKWIRLITDSHRSLSNVIFTDILMSLVDTHTVAQTSLLVTNLTKLYSKKGLIKIKQKDCNILFTYLHFRLIYIKLILGIVIASKISI